MSIAKNRREAKRQLGQFLTPPPLARRIVENLPLRVGDKVLEPSMGDGSFVIPLVEKFMALHSGAPAARLAKTLSRNVHGVEIDPALYGKCLAAIRAKWGDLPPRHNFVCGDFLLANFRDESGSAVLFDHVAGNPPFGGTINERHQDELDRRLGTRDGVKIKKETYSFFIVKSLDLLRPDGRLSFICSDTFMTIKTMKGLRDLLSRQGRVEIARLSRFSDEVSQQTVLLQCDKTPRPLAMLVVDGEAVAAADILATPNHSWGARREWAKYFGGEKIGDIMTATSGMTVGKNALFVREIRDGEITEPFRFSFYRRPVVLAEELSKARLGKLSAARIREIQRMEAAGETVRDLRISPRKKILSVALPHPDYRPYNKAAKESGFYAHPRFAIFWRDDGDAVHVFKKNGNWYLRGVGGKKHFFREGLTWNLISSRLRMKHLPPGRVLDSGAPCLFPNPGTPRDELFFVLAWSASDLCGAILKNVINHTKNIQGKDVERLPYPFWVGAAAKSEAIAIAKEMVKSSKNGASAEAHATALRRLSAIFSAPCPECRHHRRRLKASAVGRDARQLSPSPLFADGAH